MLRAKGFSLVELMVALLLSSLLVGSAIAILSSTVRHSHQTVNTIRLYQDLESVVLLMSNDIRRAGYWSNVASDVDSNSNNNPYMAAATDLKINNNNCVLLSYDANNDGVLAALNSTNDERFGYRLRGTAVQARPSSGQFNCNSSDTNWEDITDRNSIVITQLLLTLANSAVPSGNNGGTINIRNVDVTITGHHVDNPAVSKTLTHRVRLRNDKFIP